RDAGWMGPVYHFLGLSVGVIYSGKGDLPAAVYDPEYDNPQHTDQRLKHLKPVDRKTAYLADITYGTNNEFGFDYLRDNMVHSLTQMNQRGHHFAIVDEVDSILIDEARTPLIISAPDTEPTDKYYRFSEIIRSLSGQTDYQMDEKLNTANLTDHGLRKVEKILGVDNLYEKDFDTLHHIEQALKAYTLFQKDKEYIVKDDQIIIVDEHTGRLMYGRRYSDGLHQAIEAKEGVKIQQESRTLATISLQNYFRMYTKLSGMTGTAATEAEELKKVYNLDVVVIPTHRPVNRTDYPDVIYKTQRAKYSAIVAEVSEKNKKGQPVLIGTKSIEQNEIVSQYLKHKKIPHSVLNAKNHEKEAEIISQAGRVKAVTVATNIAGRGVDIVLGGDPQDREKITWQKEHDQVIASGGLHIIGAVRHESRRIDNQLRGRSGRQGDSGSSRFYVSLEDDIMRIFGGDQVSRLMDFLKVPEDQPLEAGMVSKAIETAQSKVESFHFDQRKHVVEYDDVMNKQREIVYKRRQQLLSEADNQALITKTDTLLEDEVKQLAVLYTPGGVDKTEADRIVKDFQMILPLDTASANNLEKRLTNLNQESAEKLLLDVVKQARSAQSKQLGEETLSQLEKFVYLSTYDELWMDHLDAVDSLREGIRLRGYAQKDPLIEYKQEAFNLFESLLARINAQIVRRIFRVRIVSQPRPVDSLPPSPLASGNGEVSTKKKIGRNDPCWCGSGKKWKHCHYPATPATPTA
ncbi:preprotein translocase subunit SecA, partial [Candidatus Collierbacteria bacterium]|nr:preprotein translocase subunit SecA [Candidatus Collierbacteria bacterium]